jgi:hypothetical protein
MRIHWMNSGLLSVLLSLGCGGAVPGSEDPDAHQEPPADATSIDACSCQKQSLVDRIAYVTAAPFLFNGREQRAFGDCAGPMEYPFVKGARVVAGSVVLETGPNEDRAWYAELGPYMSDIRSPESPDFGDHVSWGATWFASAKDEDHYVHYTYTCLRMPEDEPGERDLAMNYTVEFGRIQPRHITYELRATCKTGVLVNGGCSVEYDHQPRVKLLRSGFNLADPTQWVCTWTNDGQGSEFEVAATAFCLEETLPDDDPCCAPAADAIVHVQHSETLSQGTNRLKVSCEPGQQLLGGNCMLDRVDSSLFGMTLFRNGFPPGDERNEWHCSWTNPSINERPLGIATAVCASSP